MKCPKCQYTNSESNKFCEVCGAKLEAPAPALRFCAACGAEMKPEARFCPSCGASVTGETKPDPPAPKAAIPPPPAAPAPMPPPASAPKPAPIAAPKPTKKRRGCLWGCLIFLALIIGGGYYTWAFVILSHPAAFGGLWEMKDGNNKVMEDRFVLEPVEGGVKVRDEKGRPLPVNMTLKPTGVRTLGATISNPDIPSLKAEISAEISLSGSELTLTAKLPGGVTQKATAVRKGMAP